MCTLQVRAGKRGCRCVCVCVIVWVCGCVGRSTRLCASPHMYGLVHHDITQRVDLHAHARLFVHCIKCLGNAMRNASIDNSSRYSLCELPRMPPKYQIYGVYIHAAHRQRRVGKRGAIRSASRMRTWNILHTHSEYVYMYRCVDRIRRRELPQSSRLRSRKRVSRSPSICKGVKTKKSS